MREEKLFQKIVRCYANKITEQNQGNNIMGDTDDKYTKAIIERQKYIDAILSSPSRNKIVVAGPGTGKTYLFKEVVKGKTNTLTLTFVNALVEDLSLEF